jgi:hypothetical protein
MLLELGHATAWHFPMDTHGQWAGHYPKDSEDAVAQLDAIKRRGADHLLIPRHGFWWLDHYAGLERHLSRHAEEVMKNEDLVCWRLSRNGGSADECHPVFIIGSPRSGTSILTWSLGQHPNLYPLEETVWFGRFHKGLADAFELGSSRGDKSQLSAQGIGREPFFRAFGQTVDDLVHQHREWPAKSLGPDTAFARARSPEDPKGRWIDGTPENSFFVRGLVELFPEARFIHLAREHRAVVRPLRGFLRIGGRQHTAPEGYQRWIRHVRACLEAEEELGADRVLRVFHRDLASEPEGLVRTCLGFLGESYSPDCLLPLNQRINSSGTGDVAADGWEEVDPSLVAEAEGLEEKLFEARLAGK